MNNNTITQVSRFGVSQIRGINIAGSTGSGIPKHVTDVSTSMANAQTGSTSTVTVTFRRDPADKTFGGVTVYVKGYQGNQTPVQIAQSSDSPLSFVLNNTGEAVSVIVQAGGNGGAAPLSTAPSSGVKLPKSSVGGYGTSTSTSGVTLKTNGNTNSNQTVLNLTSGSNISLAESSGNVTVTNNFNFTGDVTNAGSVATVVGLQGITIPSGTPIDGDELFYSVVDGQYERLFAYDWCFTATGSGAFPNFNVLTGPWLNVSGSVGGSNTTAAIVNDTVLPSGMQWQTGTAGTANAFWSLNSPSTAPFNQIRRIRTICKLQQIVSTRFWIGVGPQTSNAGMLTDNPNQNFLGFRFSSTTDTNFMAYAATSNVNFTATNTGVAADTNLHIFDIVYTGTKALFYIDNVLVATITTNLPATTVTANPIMAIDNKASGVAKGFVFYIMKGCMPRQYR